MISIENLYFSYTGAPPFVLNGINLRIEDGEYISFLGDNGSGKTTLMRLILKLLSPTGGQISVNAKRTGYVPQKNDFSNAHFPITVYEAMNSYRKLLKIKDRGAIQTSLERVGMAEYKNSLMGALSGGQSQKIMIARALMGSPDLLVLDEPSTGVDVHSQREIYACLRELNRQNGITILSVEHNLEAAIANSTQIYHLKGGRGHLCSPEKYADEFLNAKGAK